MRAKNIMTIKCVVFLLVFFPAVKLTAQKVDFNGEWKINTSKTDFGMAPQWVLPGGVSIKQDKKQISITRKVLDEQMSEHPYTETFNYKAKDTVGTQTYNGSRKVTLVWSKDGTQLIIWSQGYAPDGSMGNTAKETWSLSGDGAELTLDREVSQPNGMAYSIKAYYTKQ